ncbi:MAG: hypothetical protein ACRDTE_25475 [Pseudonocardiaceae bacterium]
MNHRPVDREGADASCLLSHPRPHRLKRVEAFPELAGFAASVGRGEEVMVKIAEAGPECLAQGGDREGVEDMVGESGGITT